MANVSRTRFQLEPAYLLNARPYQDSSLLIEVLTRQHGRSGLIARSARGPKSKLRALLQPLQPLLLSALQSGDLGTLTAAEPAGAPIVLTGERVFYAWYLNELLIKLLPRHDVHADLFDRYALALNTLQDVETDVTLRLFEKHLLAELGYGLQLPDDVQPLQHYRCDAGMEPMPCVASSTSYPGSSLIALAQEQLDTPQARKDAQRLLKAAIRHQLNGKTLETPAMLRALRARMNP